MIERYSNPSHPVRSGKALLWLVLLLVVAGGAAAVWFFLLKGPGAPSADFNLVPRDATAFATVRVAEVAKTPIGQKLLENMKKNIPIEQMENEAGLKPEDIERATAVFTDPKDEDLSWVIIHTVKAYDKDKLLKMDKMEEKEHQGKKYHTAKSGKPAFLFLSDKQFVMGTEKGLKKCLEQPDKPKEGPLDGYLAIASDKKNHIAAGGVIPAEMSGMLKKQTEGIPFPVATLLEAKIAYMAVNVADRLGLEVGLEMPDSGIADKATKEVNSIIDTAKGLLAFGKEGMLKDLGEAGKPVGDEIDKVMADLKAKQSGKKVVLSTSIDGNVLAQAVEKVQGAAGKSVTQNNFRQVALALINACDQNDGNIPTHAIYSKDGKPLLSWRVAILPQLDDQPLYEQIKKDEPWDSDHNKKFWSRMPRAFEMPGHPAKTGMTTIQVFTGKNTLFDGKNVARFPASLTDGPTQTIMIVEGKTPVNWMEPKDIELGTEDWDNLRAKIGTGGGKGPIASMWDTAIKVLNPGISNKTLKAAATPNANDILGSDW